MIYVLLRFRIEDFAKWKLVFEEAAVLRKSFGSMGVRAFAKTDSPNEITILGEYTDLEQATELYQSQALRDKMQSAGIKGPPDITYLNEVMKLPA